MATETLDDSPPWTPPPRRGDRPRLVLVIAWSLDEPGRVGESAAVDERSFLGREEAEGPGRLLRFAPARPAGDGPAAALTSARISRVQLEVEPRGDDTLFLRNLGRAKLLVNGEERAEAEVQPGDTLTLRHALVLLVVKREPWVRVAGALPTADFPFGAPDRHGVVGESVAAWRQRGELAFLAANHQHVLLRGPSGVGKELAARVLHERSPRAHRPMVARNAATFPEGLVDAELFGTARNYPNTGSPERLGLIGEADGSTLFLDEIGELSPALQSHLLRVLDAGGEYQRLGDVRARRSDLRLLAATNRPIEALKHDFAARFTARVELVGLEARREDIPLLLRAALARIGAENPAVRERFFDATGAPRLHPELVEALLRHVYTHHTRELHRLLWRAIATSAQEYVGLTPEVRAELTFSAAADAVPPDKAAVEAALAAAGGRAAVAAEQLGLRNRFVLYRLMKKYGISDD